MSLSIVPGIATVLMPAFARSLRPAGCRRPDSDYPADSEVFAVFGGSFDPSGVANSGLRAV